MAYDDSTDSGAVEPMDHAGMCAELRSLAARINEICDKMEGEEESEPTDSADEEMMEATKPINSSANKVSAAMKMFSR